MTQVELTQKLNQLEEEKRFYKTAIEKNRSALHELKSNPANLEKFAREKYLMKKDNEDIFVIVEEHSHP
jgi:cell division protein FtsB